MFKRYVSIATMLLIILTISACSNESGGEGEENEDVKSDNQEANSEDTPSSELTISEPVTLTFMSVWNDELFETRIKGFVEEKFPNVTMELISTRADSDGLQEMFAADIMPDLLHITNGFGPLQELDMLFPLEDMVEQYGLDLDKVRTGALESTRAMDPALENRLLGFPIEEVAYGLFYNKSLFDQFGVDYPTNGMTWEEVIELARDVTREVDEVKYRGLVLGTSVLPLLQLSPQGVDPETGEVSLASESDFSDYLDLMKEITEIPGNYEPEMEESFEGQQVAMFISTLTSQRDMYGDDQYDFDLVRVPTWSDHPDIGPHSRVYPVSISPYSEHKEEAFAVLNYLVSEEMQAKMARAAQTPVSDEPNVHQEYAAYRIEENGGDDIYNFQAAYELMPAQPPLYTPSYPGVPQPFDFVAGRYEEFVQSNDDTPTFLRKLEDEYKGMLEDARNRYAD